MVTDGQVSELRRWLAAGKSLAASARMASMEVLLELEWLTFR